MTYQSTLSEEQKLWRDSLRAENEVAAERAKLAELERQYAASLQQEEAPNVELSEMERKYAALQQNKDRIQGVKREKLGPMRGGAGPDNWKQKSKKSTAPYARNPAKSGAGTDAELKECVDRIRDIELELVSVDQRKQQLTEELDALQKRKEALMASENQKLAEQKRRLAEQREALRRQEEELERQEAALAAGIAEPEPARYHHHASSAEPPGLVEESGAGGVKPPKEYVTDYGLIKIRKQAERLRIDLGAMLTLMKQNTAPEPKFFALPLLGVKENFYEGASRLKDVAKAGEPFYQCKVSGHINGELFVHGPNRKPYLVLEVLSIPGMDMRMDVPERKTGYFRLAAELKNFVTSQGNLIPLQEYHLVLYMLIRTLRIVETFEQVPGKKKTGIADPAEWVPGGEVPMRDVAKRHCNINGYTGFYGFKPTDTTQAANWALGEDYVCVLKTDDFAGMSSLLHFSAP